MDTRRHFKIRTRDIEVTKGTDQTERRQKKRPFSGSQKNSGKKDCMGAFDSAVKCAGLGLGRRFKVSVSMLFE